MSGAGAHGALAPVVPLSTSRLAGEEAPLAAYRHGDVRAFDRLFDRWDRRPDQAYEVAQARERLGRIAATLPTQQRAAFLMREVEGLSYQEIADRLGIGHGAVESLLFRARRRFRKEYLRLEGEERVSAPAAPQLGRRVIVAEVSQQDGADFFISYTHADRGSAEWIAWELEAVGFTTLLQAWDFAPGTNLESMKNGLLPFRG
jgi:transposase